jgi:hypothetical protein
MSDELTKEEAALCDAAAVVTTARFALAELIIRLEHAGDPDALLAAETCKRTLEAVAARISSKIGMSV